MASRRSRFTAQAAELLAASDSGSEPESQVESPCEDIQDEQPRSPVIHRQRRRAQNRNTERPVLPSDGAGDNTTWEMATDEEEPQQWLPPYNGETGFMGRENLLDNILSPVTVLFLFLTAEFWNLLVIETNRYAEQFFVHHTPSARSRFRNWAPVTVSEMKAFFSLTFSMGLVEKTEIEEKISKTEIGQKILVQVLADRNSWIFYSDAKRQV